MSRFCFCNCPAGFSAEPERHAPDCPGRSGAGKARTPVPATLTASQPVESGVDFGIDGRSVRVSQEAYSIFLAREAAGREKTEALQQRLNAADQQIDELGQSKELLREAYNEASPRLPYRIRQKIEQFFDGLVVSMSQDAEVAPIKGMIEAVGGKYAIMIDQANSHYGWIFKKDPNGMWVSGRKATDAEIHAARTYAHITNQQ